MVNEEYLNEKKYQKTKKKIIIISLIILIVGILIGGSLIATGVLKNKNLDVEYATKEKENLEKKKILKKQLDTEKIRLENELEKEKVAIETKIAKLKSKGIKYNWSVNYTEGETYDLKIMTQTLDSTFNHCKFDEAKTNKNTLTYCAYKNVLADVYCDDREKSNELTLKYCSLIEQYKDITKDTNYEFDKQIDKENSIPFYMIGGFIIAISCMISLFVFMIAKRREITAFSVQQVMPVAQEGIEKMTPTLGKAGASIAKEISTGIKEGMKDKE